jgi:hypothetical protein
MSYTILYQFFTFISSGLVTLLKVTDASIHVPDSFYLTISFKFNKLSDIPSFCS